MKPELTTLEGYINNQISSRNKLTELISNNGKSSHTPKEIAQQPYTWRNTAKLMVNHAPDLKNFLQEAGLYNQEDRPGIILTGAGTSDYVGLSLVDLLRITFGTSCHNWATTRITANPDAYFSGDQKYVMVHFARSGNSPESIAVLEMALKYYPNVSHHIVITCNAEGDLARMGNDNPGKVYSIVLDEATNDKGLAMTSSYSNMVLAGQSLAWLDNMGEFENLTDRVAGAGEFLINSYADSIYQLADPALTRAFYLGNNELFGTAAESALKVQELTSGQLIAKYEDTMAFRHGPISAVDSSTMVCFLLSGDAYTLRYELDVLRQFQKQFQEIGTRIVVVSAAKPSAISEEINEDVHFISFDPDNTFNIPHLYQVNIQVLFGQLLGLFSASRRGLNVDDPASANNALYSRTVKGVTLYDPVADVNI